jgi:hypothetical protein
MDRLRARYGRRRGRARGFTKPGTLLKSQIPIRTWAEWNEDRPGFCEVDLVDHSGGHSRGDHAWTLIFTDIKTTWTECVAVRNKAQTHVFAAVQRVRRRLPFPLLGIDSDNSSEFINNELYRYCQREHITFTRSRAGRKNDNAHVEQKNWSVVRRAVGYERYGTPEQLYLLNRYASAPLPLFRDQMSLHDLESLIEVCLQVQQRLLRDRRNYRKPLTRACWPVQRCPTRTRRNSALPTRSSTSSNSAASGRTLRTPPGPPGTPPPPHDIVPAPPAAR